MDPPTPPEFPCPATSSASPKVVVPQGIWDIGFHDYYRAVYGTYRIASAAGYHCRLHSKPALYHHLSLPLGLNPLLLCHNIFQHLAAALPIASTVTGRKVTFLVRQLRMSLDWILVVSLKSVGRLRLCSVIDERVLEVTARNTQVTQRI